MILFLITMKRNLLVIVAGKLVLIAYTGVGQQILLLVLKIDCDSIVLDGR